MLAVCLGAPSVAAAQSRPAHAEIDIALPASAPAPVSGRLLLFATPARDAKLPDLVDANEFDPQSVTVAAQEIENLQPGFTVDMDPDIQAYPAGFSHLKPGAYFVQAVLDTRHDYAYAGRAAGDLTSKVVKISITAQSGVLPKLDLVDTVPASDPWQQPARVPAEIRALVAAARPHATAINFRSPTLTQFWGRPITLHGWVLTPPGYDPAQTAKLPTIYYIHGFGGSASAMLRPLGYINAAMQKAEMPPMIWVFLDMSSPTGTTEFADSVNNGPWGQALTTELIPDLEHTFRMQGGAAGRFLTGHSSGGWATLWLQTQYPKIFGGTWSTSPDPSDFHDFTGVDIYAPHANAYRRADGTAYPLVRIDGKVVATLQQVAQLEAVLGPAGGQMSSFDWVFSPRGPDGAPQPLFDRATGAIDPKVAAYWRDKYDIAHLVTTRWPAIAPDLTGKIHIWVGTADTFYLDGPAHRLQTALDQLHAHAQFTFVPGRTHMDLYREGKDPFALEKDIAWDIDAIARPGSQRPLKK
jgi:S-formylglutathione hydrolase FrmB